MDGGSFDTFIDAVAAHYEDSSDVAVDELGGSAGRTVQIRVTKDTEEEASKRGREIRDKIAHQFDARARHVATTSEQPPVAEVLAVPEYSTFDEE